MKHIERPWTTRLLRITTVTVLVALLLGCHVDAAQAQAELGFDPLHSVITGDETLSVFVTIDASVGDLRGFTWILEFDSTIVKPIAVTAGPLVVGAACPHFVLWLNSTAVGDSIAIDGATLGCSVAGPGAIVEIQFIGFGFGISPLVCRRSDLRDSLNVSIPHDCMDGSIARIVVAVESRAWSMVKELFR